jgi:hypothetical protein
MCPAASSHNRLLFNPYASMTTSVSLVGNWQQFLFKSGLPVVDRIDLNSEFREPGNNCYMRETVGYALMK